jgi:hypothetical protein
MHSTISRALSDANIRVSRGSHPGDCSEWVVAGIADDMITFKSSDEAKITINIRYPEESMEPVFEAHKIHVDNTREEITRSNSFTDTWDAALTKMN